VPKNQKRYKKSILWRINNFKIIYRKKKRGKEKYDNVYKL